MKLYRSIKEDKERYLDLIIGRYGSVAKGGSWPDAFAWPLAKVVSPRLGIAMRRAPQDLRPMIDFIALKFARTSLSRDERGSWAGHLWAATRLARTVARLHLSGLCHSDLSWNNVYMSARDGRCMLLDCDGLVVPNFLPPAVLGTPGCMAPELVAQRAKPSVLTDLHALAVLVYRLLLLRHPLCGPLRLGGEPEQEDRLLFGERALFAEHPSDHRNRPSRMGVTLDHLGPELKTLFLRAFVGGLHDPGKRPTASEWEHSLALAQLSLVRCGNEECEFKDFITTDRGAPRCPWCDEAPSSLPGPLLSFKAPLPDLAGQYGPRPDFEWLASKGKPLLPWCFDPNLELSTAPESSPVAFMDIQKGRWGIVLANRELRVFGKPGLPGDFIVLEPGDRLLYQRNGRNRMAEVVFPPFPKRA